MRRIRYQVASSVDGFIAGPNGNIDWIVHEPGIDFGALFAQFDTLLMGRRTYTEMMEKHGGLPDGQKVIVVSRTLRQADHPNVQVVSDDLRGTIERLRAQPGKDIWLFGGGELLRSMLEINCVDTIEPAIMPALVGGGVPLLPTPALTQRLSLTSHRVFPSGIVWLEYAVQK